MKYFKKDLKTLTELQFWVLGRRQLNLICEDFISVVFDINEIIALQWKVRYGTMNMN